ncbi:MAG TPA: RHS repeat-associated core domain-containing protein [Chitinophagaceae bacterium]|nr:RHS repeat-associated core domain-containing protein [Chitinophagaceae bacterium]
MRYTALMILFGWMLSMPGLAQYSSTTSDLNMNWIVVKTFKADGSVESIRKQYFDNSGRIMQGQYRNFTAGQVLATQVIMDAYGRPAVNTLPAPINSGDFGYKTNFVTNASGTAYTYQNFDDAKTNNPDPVGQSTPGTLGWYYSNNNTMENRVPESTYPYSRADFYKDGTSSVKRTTVAGAAFKMGSGHENSEFVYPSVGEFTHYVQVRSKFFPTSEIGQHSSTYRKSTLKVFRDANGRETFVMLDDRDRPMITARPGSDIQLHCSMSITADTRNTAYINANSTLYINPNAQIEVYVGQTLYYTGPASGWSVSALGAQNGMIRSASPFSYKDCGGSGCSGITPAVPRPAVHYFKILQDNTPVSILNIIGGSYTLYDMSTETPITLSGTLNKGYYKVVANTGDVMVQYSNSYSDISYYYYNQLGQLVATIAPEGVKLLINNLNGYATKNDVPFMQLYEYDLRGKMIAATMPDGGRTEFVYRKDGLLRFSQNSKQAALGWFCYTNYDQYGRPTESGEYRPSGDVTFAGLKTNNTIIEDVSSTGGLPILSNKYEWVRTKYAAEDNSHGLPYYHTYIRNSISVTESPNTKTWYNYNEEGKLLWTIHGIKDYGSPGVWGYKVTEYVYDSEWRIAKVLYQKNQPDMFVYWYEYDADGRIDKIYTNTTDNVGTRMLQSKYSYYVHGPLKRTEIGGNLQGLDYTYTVQGLPKAINHSNKAYDPGQDGVVGSPNAGFLEDAFGMTLEYFNGDYSRSGTNIGSISINSADAPELFTGTVRGMSWFSKKPNSSPIPATPTMYVFKYDDRYQFREATWGAPQFPAHSFTAQPGVNKEIVSLYDMNGNIRNLSRTNFAGATTDNFQYNYYSSPKPQNRLHQVIQQSTSQVFSTYQYDNLGQVTAELPGPANDPGNPNKYLQYDVAGKVTGVYRDAAFTVPIVRYVYNEVGERVKKLSYNSAGSLLSTTYYIYDAGRNLMSIYTQPNGGSIAQTEIPIWGGGDRVAVLMRGSNTYRYEMTDYLGNVRSVIIRNGGTLDAVVFRDYYPFGHPIPQREQTDADGYRYAYQGEYAEKDPETNWNAFDLRMYDSRIGRWLSVDPYQQLLNPYLAVGNNPLNNIDEDGGWIHILVGAVVGAVVEGVKVVQEKGWKGLTTGEGITKVLYGAGSGALVAAAPGVSGAVVFSGATNVGGQIINNAFDPNKRLFDIDKSQVFFSSLTAGLGAKGGDMLRKPMANALEKWGRSASNTLFIPGRGTHKFIEKAYRPWWYTERQGLATTMANLATDPLNRYAEGYMNESWDRFEMMLQRAHQFAPYVHVLPEIIIKARRKVDAIKEFERRWRRRAAGLE